MKKNLMVVFDVKKEHLSNLDPAGAVDLVRKLVWADATASGLGTNLINVPSEINAGDGGVDGEVSHSEFRSEYGIIKAGNTRYQVKSGNFSLVSSDIEKILLKSNKLNERIRSCLEKNGTLVIVFTGWDKPDASDDQVKNKFIDRLKEIDPKYAQANIEIWRQNTIIGFLQSFPSLRLDILKINDNHFLFHDTWARISDMKHTRHFGTGQEKFVQNIQKDLRENNRQPVHIRVTGEPGIGKTKLVLEATRSDDLSPLTIYVDDPAALENMGFINQLTRVDNKSFVILVVDECNFTEQTKLWNRIEDRSPDIKLITIFNESDKFSGTTRHMSAPPLKDEQITEILTEYDVPGDQALRWVRFCSPSPRAAHIIGHNLKSNPSDILKSPDTVPVWDRYIASSTDLQSSKFKNRQIVLRWISLFKKFGFEPPFEQEAKVIARKIDEHHKIPYGEFIEIVKKLRRMKILQGPTTALYITPKILHIELWTEWWENYDDSMLFKFEELVIPSQNGIGINPQQSLLKWFIDMFGYARESPSATETVERILDDILAQSDILSTKLGADFFLKIARVNAKKSLDILNSFISSKNKDELVAFTHGRRQIISILERASRKKYLFTDSARLLLALGEAENEDYANNASGIFVGLFSPGSGDVSPTEMPPSERLPIIKEALMSDSEERRLLAIKACNAALETTTFSRWIEVEDDPRDDFMPWHPKSNDEVVEYYKFVLEILKSALEGLEEDERRQAISVILGRARGLITHIPETSEVVIGTIQELHDRYDVDELIVETIMEIIDFDSELIPRDTVAQLEKIRDVVTGSDYHSLMRRYVGMSTMMDQASDSLRKTRESEVAKLAEQSLDVNLLRPELAWLVTSHAKNGYEFGYKLGRADKNFQLLSTISEAQKNGGSDVCAFFMGGYFSALFERDQERWEAHLDSMANDPTLCKFVPEVTYRSGITDRAGKRIISLVRRHDLNFMALSYFRYGRPVSQLSESVFVEWLAFLKNESNSKASVMALDLFYSFFVHGKPERKLPKDLALSLLFHQNIVKEPSSELQGDAMLEHYWKETCMQFMKQYPSENVLIAEKILENFSENRFLCLYNSQALDVLDEIIRANPSEVWKVVLFYIGPPVDSRASQIAQWLRGGLSRPTKESVFTKITPEEIFAWVDQDPGKRAPYLASFVPPVFEIARTIVSRYGEMDSVRRSLEANFNTESWRGSGSTHYQAKKDKFSKLREQENDPKVRAWLDHYIAALEQLRQRSAKSEEREDF